MRGLELKKIVEICWKNSTTKEEKFPINPKNCKPTTDNGSITMDRTLSADDIYRTPKTKKYADDSIESRKEEVPEKMSILRKLCFFLSLNGGVLYFVVLAWLLPCRWSPCSMSNDIWSSNFSNIRITTNMETNILKNPSLLIFGYIDDEGNKMSALRMSDGKHVWNHSLPEEPNHISCNLGKYAGARKDYCFVIAKGSIAAFNPENGDLAWEQKIMSSQEIGAVALNQEVGGKAYLIGISTDLMSLFDLENGTKVSTISLPCSWTNNVKITGPWQTKHGSIWALICQYDDGMEVFTFENEDFLNFSNNNTDSNGYRDIKFKRIVSQQSYSGSIDLVGDVTTSPNSLVLSWADMVTMVTAQAPFHHFHKTWERRFSNGSAAAVTSIELGYFIDLKNLYIAAAVQNGVNTTIHILDSQNGSTIFEWELEAKKIISIKKIPGAKKERNVLLLESSDITNITNANSGSRSFYTLQYENGEAVLRRIVTVENFLTSSFSPISEGKSNLLVSSTNHNGDVIFDRYIIQNKDPELSWCKDEKKDGANSTTVLFFE